MLVLPFNYKNERIINKKKDLGRKKSEHLYEIV